MAHQGLARLKDPAEASGTSFALGLLARSEALVCSTDDAHHLYEHAIALLRTTGMSPDLGRAHLLFGEWLRRRHERRMAAEQLEMACKIVGAIGAQGFEARALTELRAIGARPPEPARAKRELTARERRISERVAQVLTNVEIASQLFISPSTIDYHLRKVYRKLDQRSRTELPRTLLSGELGQWRRDE